MSEAGNALALPGTHAQLPATHNTSAPALARSDVVVTEDATREATWRLSVVLPIIEATGDGTPARKAAVAARAEMALADWRGERRKLSERSIYRWIKGYRADGFAGLMRKAPANAGQPRVHVSRAYDAEARASGLSEEALAELGERICQKIRGQWTNGTPSARGVRHHLYPIVRKLSLEAGVRLPSSRAAWMAVCKVPLPKIEAERLYAAVAIKEKDAGAYAAALVPRIGRDRSHFRPGGWVAGDVHHVDILFRTADGREVTPKAVAWKCLATNRARFTIFILPKGRMIGRAEVVQSFIEMCQDPDWGVPSHLYVDNGGEYNWAGMVNDLARLKHKVSLRLEGLGEICDVVPSEAPRALHRSKPYTPQSKVIETLFSSTERQAFRQIPGWIGGNREKKKTANQGRKPEPFPGDEAQLRAAIAVAIAYWHTLPQDGHLNGASPMEKFEAFKAAGWRATIMDADQAAVAFAVEHLKPVNTGGIIKLDGRYYCPELMARAHMKKKVRVRQPLCGDRSTLYVFEADASGRFIGIAKRDDRFPFDTTEGAKEQHRRAQLLDQQLKALAANADREGDGLTYMRDVVAMYDDATEAPEPEAVISIDAFRDAAMTRREAPAREAQSADAHEAARERKSDLLAQMTGSGR